MNTAIAEAKDPVLMASAMKHAVIAGRQSYLAGRMPKKRYADPSSRKTAQLLQLLEQAQQQVRVGEAPRLDASLAALATAAAGR